MDHLEPFHVTCRGRTEVGGYAFTPPIYEGSCATVTEAAYLAYLAFENEEVLESFVFDTRMEHGYRSTTIFRSVQITAGNNAQLSAVCSSNDVIFFREDRRFVVQHYTECEGCGR